MPGLRGTSSQRVNGVVGVAETGERTSEQLILLGGGALAREIAATVAARNDVRPEWDVVGFLDDDPSTSAISLDTRATVIPRLGPLPAVDEHPAARFTLALATPKRVGIRAEVVARLGLAPERMAQIVHPTCALAPSTCVGAGSSLLAGVVATADVCIGNHVVVMPNTVFTHDDRVGDYSTFGAGVLVAGRVTIGSSAYIGAGARIREGVTIGDGALVGMGSVVTRDVPAGEVWAGSPARPLRRAPEGVFVHPLGVCESSNVGAGTRVWAFAHVLDGAVVGERCNICDHAFIENGARLGDNVTVKNGVLVFDLVTLEDDVFVGPGVVFTNDLRPRAAIKKSHDELGATLVRAGSTLGAGAVIVCGTTVGEYAFVAAGAVVTRDVPAHALMAGNPARRVGWACECGERLADDLICSCGRRYRVVSPSSGLGKA